jgi:hypothetical protein
MASRVRFGPLAACVWACMAAAGCSTFRETHYFRAVNGRGEPVNYFRVKVRGYSFLSSSRYTSGYYDETAVDTYFGEYVQPEKGKFPSTQPAAEGRIESVNKDLSNRSLLLLLTTNVDAIAEGIQSLAQSESVANLMLGVVAGSRFQEAGEASQELDLLRARARVLATRGESLVKNLPDDASQAAAEQNLIQYANELIAHVDRNRSFTTLDQVADWLRENGPRAMEGSR